MTWKCCLVWILFVVEWSFMVIIAFLPFSFCQPKVDFLWSWWIDTTVVNCIHSLAFTIHGTFFCYSTVRWFQLVTRCGCNLTIMPFVYLGDILHKAVTKLHCVSLKILCSLWTEADLGLLEAVNYYHKALHLGCCSSPRSVSYFGKCLLINRRKIVATFVDTDLILLRNKFVDASLWILLSHSTFVDIAKLFLRLIKRYFPKCHRLHKIFNKNTLNVNYSCIQNICKICKGHNSRITSIPCKQLTLRHC